MSKSLPAGCAGCSGCSLAAAPAPASAPTITVIAGINPSHQHGVEFDDADLLILTKMLDADLGPGPMAFDAHHGGVVTRALHEANFKGAVGEHLNVLLPDSKRRVIVIGLGKSDEVTRRRVCDLFSYALNLACQYNSQTMLLPIFPQRSSGPTLNLRGTGAILRCLVDEKVRRGALSQLKEIRLLCAPQAKRHLVDGLAIDRVLCGTCRRPD
ncbi:MAG: hypothetical protein JSS83_29215 [Cyanobacteria bacterium SZAS LIN-3]|nr:hypothetical protein [Cyanobacteria bacterium SZAS LIN-3]MBS2011191.1 hypothetical protein [Cyanobacteria bacterium SZAS TMP-1]